MSEPLKYRELAALARSDALRKAENSYPPFDPRKAPYYREQVLREYINRISPITADEVLLG